MPASYFFLLFQAPKMLLNPDRGLKLPVLPADSDEMRVWEKGVPSPGSNVFTGFDSLDLIY